MQVNPGCITYDGCSVPTHWCSHNDNGYNSTDGRQHGWPCFATSAMAAFFQSFCRRKRRLNVTAHGSVPWKRIRFRAVQRARTYAMVL
jgi:hypothetical protein